MQNSQQEMAAHVSEKQRVVCRHLNSKECA